MKWIKKIKKKKEGSSIYIWMIVFFLFIALMSSLNMYQRSAAVISDNLKTSLDTANLAATTIDVSGFLSKNHLGLIGHATASNALTEEEKVEVLRKYDIFQTALMENVGLDSNFNFKGGTCGWAGNHISSGPLVLSSFTIYEIIDDHVYAYQIKNITNETSSPTITKTDCGEIGVATTDSFISSDGRTITQTIKGPMVCSQVEFPLNTKFLDNLFYTFYNEGEEGGPEIEDSIQVSKYSITELRSNQ